MRLRSGLLVAIALAFAPGCVVEPPAVSPVPRGGTYAKAHGRSPLPIDEQVVAGPSEQASLLGRVLLQPYDPAQPIVAQVSPNPCAENLVDVKPRPLDGDTVEDAVLLPAPAEARRYYRAHVSQRLEKAATPAYAACCTDHACGVGYVRSITLGEGETALARPTLPGGNADVAYDDMPEPYPLELSLSDRRQFKGLISVAIDSAGAPTRPMPPMPPSAPEPPTTSAYENDKIEVRENKHNPDIFELCLSSRCITENEFVRLYTKKTGARELAEIERDRFESVRLPAALMSGVGLLAAVAGGLAAGVKPSSEAPRSSQDAQKIMGGAVSTLGVGLLLTGLIILSTPKDGYRTDHFLTKKQALRYVERYNRALREAR